MDFATVKRAMYDDSMSFLRQDGDVPLTMIWCTVFVLTLTLLLRVGFGSRGIVPGSAAASFQRLRYGAFTPRGGYFARLTSLGMLLRLAGCLKGLGKDIISLRHAMLLGQLEERLKKWRCELAADMVRPDHAAEVKGATIDEATIAVNSFINSIRELPEFLESGEAEMLTELKTDLEGRALEIAR
ncbi:hypothetical protein KCV03_g9215, partial [Aureobasidium melanogenum]